MKQQVIIPEVRNCFCGSKARTIDWDFRGQWVVMCDQKNHTMTRQCATRNRAIHRWNERVTHMLMLLESDDD